MKKILILILLIHTYNFILSNSSLKKHPYQVPQTDSLIKVDGILEPEVWEKALKIDLQYEVEPGENIKATVRTECRLIYGKHHLYISFKSFDPNPKAIRAYLNDRDSGVSEDWVGIILDTFNDKRRAFDFRSNPLGIQSDGIFTDDKTDFSWDAIWEAEGRIYEWGYMVEMAIPFNALRFQKSQNKQIWGFDAVRHYPRMHHYYFGTFPRDRNKNSYLAQTIKIEGFKDAKPGKNIEITPTLTAVRTDNRKPFPEGNMEKTNSEIEAGVTARLGITSNLVLNATINPDFSQVEADSLQLDINKPFALYYTEKRPFFTEGADFFKPKMTDFLGTSLNVIYTRAIRNPSWGIKLTGKSINDTYGGFIVRDEITNLIFPGNVGSRSISLFSPNTASVFRFKKNFGSRYTFGLLATNRQSDNYYNRLIGIDANMRVTDKDIIQFQFFNSNTKYPEEIAAQFHQNNENLNGTVIDFNYQHNTKTLDYYARFQSFNKDFRADLGYIPRVDYRRYRVGGSYTLYAIPENWYSRIKLSGEVDIIEDLQGNLINGGGYIWGTLYGSLQSRLSIILGQSKQKFQQMEFGKTTLSIMGSIQLASNVRLGINGNFGDHIDYENIRKAKIFSLSPSFVYNIGRHLNLSFTYNYEHLNVDVGRLYTANIADSTITYQLNKKISLQSVIQYVYYNYQVSNYLFGLEPEFKHVFTQFRFSYKMNPRTVIFLGYSDNYLGNQNFRLKQNDKTLFVKIGYALQM